jgi:DNA-binding response OmpR family regulator
MTPISIGSLRIDPDRFIVYRGEHPIILRKKEFEILYLLMEGAGKIYSRDAIASRIWDKERLSFPRTIDVHISNIRKKIGKIGDNQVIVVLRGVGYKINERIYQSSNS